MQNLLKTDQIIPTDVGEIELEAMGSGEVKDEPTNVEGKQ